MARNSPIVSRAGRVVGYVARRRRFASLHRMHGLQHDSVDRASHAWRSMSSSPLLIDPKDAWGTVEIMLITLRGTGQELRAGGVSIFYEHRGYDPPEAFVLEQYEVSDPTAVMPDRDSYRSAQNLGRRLGWLVEPRLISQTKSTYVICGNRTQVVVRTWSVPGLVTGWFPWGTTCISMGVILSPRVQDLSWLVTRLQKAGQELIDEVAGSARVTRHAHNAHHSFE
jgi:hypothetical protein